MEIDGRIGIRSNQIVVGMPATFRLSRMVRPCLVGAFVIASLAVSHGHATAAEADVPASPSERAADDAAAPNSRLTGSQVTPSAKQVTRRCCSGLGAGIGAFTARPSITSPIRPPKGSSVTVQPVISRQMIGGGVGITF